MNWRSPLRPLCWFFFRAHRVVALKPFGNWSPCTRCGAHLAPTTAIYQHGDNSWWTNKP